MPLIPHCDECGEQMAELAPGDEPVIPFDLRVSGRRLIFCDARCLILSLTKAYGRSLIQAVQPE